MAVIMVLCVAVYMVVWFYLTGWIMDKLPWRFEFLGYIFGWLGFIMPIAILFDLGVFK